ncbi:MAG: type 4a pilus biogenesis protein PilO [Moraxellaceae bacterium]|nr:type 4a pilus biogenesis protein PilO [Pseudobdellovibrionaceae bacterium]
MNETSPIQKIIQTVGSFSLPRVALLAGVLTAIYYFTLYDDGSVIIQGTEAAKQQLVSENAKKIETQKVLKKEQQMKADVELLAKKFEEIKARIPLDFLESDLRTIVDHYSSQNNLKTTRTDRRPAPVRANQNNPGIENLIEQVPLGYEFEGSYNNIAKFVLEISGLEKLIKIGDFDLAVKSESGNKKTKDLVFKANIIGFKQSLEAMRTNAKKESP